MEEVGITIFRNENVLFLHNFMILLQRHVRPGSCRRRAEGGAGHVDPLCAGPRARLRRKRPRGVPLQPGQQAGTNPADGAPLPVTAGHPAQPTPWKT
jgi:hypothetical protein